MAGRGRRTLLPLCLLLAAGCTLALADGTAGEAIVLKNSKGVEAHILPLGGCIQRLLVPARDGVKDIMLGFDDPEQYRVRRAERRGMGAGEGRDTAVTAAGVSGQYRLNRRCPQANTLSPRTPPCRTAPASLAA